MATTDPARFRFPFEYATVETIRAEGLLLSDASDARVRSLIRDASSYLNRLTSQWFTPQEQIVRVDGDNDRITRHPDLLPILRVNELAIEGGFPALVGAGFVSSIYDPDSFVVDGRMIHLRDVDTRLFAFGQMRFPAGERNIRTDGWFGWLEDSPKTKDVKTPSTTAVTSASTSVTVVDSSRFAVGDVIQILAADRSAGMQVILTGVNQATKVLTWETVNALAELLGAATLAIGSSVETFGRVPRAIERATVLLVVKYKDQLASAQAAAKRRAALVQSETTDNYSYSLSGAPGGDLTGDAMIDRLIEDYTAPMPAEFV